ncbi:MAG: response regulator transcription factor [Hyphomicrobiales bacterium]
MNILVIEDDAEIRSDIEIAAQELDLAVFSVTNLADALSFLKNSQPAIVIADRMLPDGDGLDAVKVLREANASALIMVVSALGRSQNRIEGFQKGADDYLTKPFDPVELRARMASLKRRAELVHKQDEVLVIHDMEIRRKARTVHRNQKHISLSPKEFDLLMYLAENRGQLVTRSMLLENVWGLHFNPQTNVVDVHIGRLRQKIDAPFAVAILQTIRGKGYLLEATKKDAIESF